MTLQMAMRSKPTNPIARNNNGFSLIEMAIVLVIVGIIISIVASVLPSLIASSKIKKAQATLEKFDYALQGYLSANGRMPCPDTDNDGIENRTPGTASPTDDVCDAYVGQIPFATLGLSSALDPWQEPVRYAVYEEMIRTQTTGLCDALPCTLCLSNFITNPTAAFLHTTDSNGTSTNQAYVLVSGGSKDMDNADGFFDSLNTISTPADFETPNKIVDANYDDLVRAASFAYLQGRLCSGSLGGGGTTTTTEGPAAGNCADGLDNDSDTLIDCLDPDCSTDAACTGGSTVTISTASIPSGVMSSTYMTTISATGGTTPYDWQLSANGGFSDFSINTSTGTLSGTLDQCPGNYTIGVGIEDDTPSASGGPYTDSQSYTLQVTSNLSVTCTSTPGASITWSSPTQVETFTASGSRLGTINWSLNTGGAAGFSVYSTGDDTCSVRKSGSTAPGTYSFTLSATDATCSTNTDDLTFDVTVTASGGGTPGAISGIVDSYTFSTFESYTPEIIHVSGDIYAVATQGWSGNGYTHTVDISSDGQIGARIDYDDFDSGVLAPDIVNVAGNIFAIAYEGGSNRGYIRTISIADNGQVSSGAIDTLNFLNSNCQDPTIIKVADDIFAIAYTGPGSDGYITTVQIDASGQISNSTIDSLEFGTSNARSIDIVHVGGDIYALAYQGPNGDGFITTISIDDTGQISNSVIDTIEFETGFCTAPDMVQVSTDVFAVAYQGPNDDGFVASVQIASDGQITDSVVDTLEFDTSAGVTPVIVDGGNSVFAIAYTGPDDDGYFSTVLIDDTGQISDTVLDSIEFETDTCLEPSMVLVASNTFAIAYRGPTGNRGVVTTITLQ